MNPAELESYLRDALEILRASLTLARGEQPAFYRVAAAQLRLLLCDTTFRHNRQEEIALLPRLRPTLALPPLTTRGGFDFSAAPIPLAAWLEQPLPDGLTIRLLIRRVCDQDGGAHVDLHPHAGSGDPQEAARWILALGDCLLRVMETG